MRGEILELYILSNFRIVTQIVNETYDNDDDLDLTYVIIVWIANLPRYLGNEISNVEHLEQNPNIMYISFKGILLA